jgi:hypothetical protein
MDLQVALILGLLIFMMNFEGNSKSRLVYSSASTYGLPVIALCAADVYSAYVGKFYSKKKLVNNEFDQVGPRNQLGMHSNWRVSHNRALSSLMKLIL